MPTVATLHARDLTVTRGPQLVLDSIELTVGPGRLEGWIEDLEAGVALVSLSLIHI